MHLSRGREQWRSCLFLCHSQGETRSPHAYVRVGGHAHVPVLCDAGNVMDAKHGQMGLPADPHMCVRARRELYAHVVCNRQRTGLQPRVV